ncbi:MAG: MCE family protein [Aquificae bacterium]|nr:MCE family protein [Aquificota bacterium]
MNTAFKVGLFVIFISLITGYLIITFSGKEFGVETKEYYLYFDAVEGLSVGADVQVKGVKAGRVENIGLEGNKVKVEIRVRSDIPIYKDAKAYVRTLGLMGDKYIYIDTGHPETGLLESGAVIKQTKVYASTEEAFASATEVAKKIEKLVDNLNKAVEEGGLTDMIANIRELAYNANQLVVENRAGIKKAIDNIVIITEELRRTLPPLVARIDRVAQNLEAITGENRQDIRELIKNLKETSVALRDKTPQLLDEIREAAEAVKGTIGENRQDIKVAIQKIREASVKLDKILTQVAQGKGTLGKLVFDDGLYNTVDKGIKDFSKPFSVINKTKLDILMYAEKHTGNEDEKAGIAGKLSPGENSYIYVGLLTNSNGTVSKEEEIISDGTVKTTVKRDYGILFDVQYAHKILNIWDKSLWVRGGLKDSSGDVGVDLNLSRNLVLKADLYNFDRKYSYKNKEADKPQLDVGFTYRFNTNPLFIKFGGSDLLNSDIMGVYIGAGFMFRDDDIKYLLGGMPKP